jgi:hypothetical protein
MPNIKSISQQELREGSQDPSWARQQGIFNGCSHTVVQMGDEEANPKTGMAHHTVTIKSPQGTQTVSINFMVYSQMSEGEPQEFVIADVFCHSATDGDRLIVFGEGNTRVKIPLTKERKQEPSEQTVARWGERHTSVVSLDLGRPDRVMPTNAQDYTAEGGAQ